MNKNYFIEVINKDDIKVYINVSTIDFICTVKEDPEKTFLEFNGGESQIIIKETVKKFLDRLASSGSSVIVRL